MNDQDIIFPNNINTITIIKQTSDENKKKY